MSRGWRVVFNIVMLLAFIGSVGIVLAVNHFTQYALLKQDQLPSNASYEDLLADIKAELIWYMHTIAPDDPTDPARHRYKVNWSTTQPWSDPDAPDSLIAGVNDNIRRLVDFQKREYKIFYFDNPNQHPILRDDGGRGSWLLAMRMRIVDDDTLAYGVCTPMDAVFDYYLPLWFDKYLHHTHSGRHLTSIAERFPMHLTVKPNHSSWDTLQLLNGADELIMFDQLFPNEDIAEYEITTHELVPGIGWLGLQGPGIMDQMLLAGARRAYWWLFATWLVLFLGMIYLMSRNERPRLG